MTRRLNQEREKRLQPERIKTCVQKLYEMGKLVVSVDDLKIVFMHNGEKVHFFPYSGWHTGKSIKDGRGWENLRRQIQ